MELSSRRARSAMDRRSSATGMEASISPVEEPLNQVGVRLLSQVDHGDRGPAIDGNHGRINPVRNVIPHEDVADLFEALYRNHDVRARRVVCQYANRFASVW